MSARALRQALADAGIACEVEAHDRLAVLVPDDDASAARLVAADGRRRAASLAREHGFTHAALELRDGDRIGGPQDFAGERAPLHRD